MVHGRVMHVYPFCVGCAADVGNQYALVCIDLMMFYSLSAHILGLLRSVPKIPIVNDRCYWPSIPINVHWERYGTDISIEFVGSNDGTT